MVEAKKPKRSQTRALPGFLFSLPRETGEHNQEEKILERDWLFDQDVIIAGLHCEPSLTSDNPYMREMKRRIWAVLRELDLQNAFEYALPTLLHNVNSNVAPPTNLDEEDFDETSKELPLSKPLSKYTFTSYQVHSSRSWSLRLEISQRLFTTRFSQPLCYDDVLRYTREITRAIDGIPAWDTEGLRGQSSPKLSTLAHAFLHFQLKECIIALHRPYLQRNDGRFWLSETVCYHTSRDILLLHSKLAVSGLQSLTVLREDLLLASLSIIRINMLQPKGWYLLLLSRKDPLFLRRMVRKNDCSSAQDQRLPRMLTSLKGSNSIIVSDSQSTMDFLEQCLIFTEDRYLRCCNGEPWCFMTMCAATRLLKIHLGKESHQTAKSSCV